MSLRLHGDMLARPGMLDFAVNVWPAPRPAHLRAALQDALRDARYPDEHGARAAVAARHLRVAVHQPHDNTQLVRAFEVLGS